MANCRFALLFLLLPTLAAAADRVTLATNWKAQPELGGFYQAVVDGAYERHGLDVTIKPGGPMVNNRPLLAFGQIEFLVGTNLLQPFDAVKQKLPTKVVAAFFQKDPQCLIAHGDGPLKTWDDLKTAPLFMGNLARQSFFRWLNAAEGFERRNLRPYNHDLAPFLLEKSAVIQGFATAEPKRIEEATNVAPRVFLLADHGWNSYSTVLETRVELIEKNPDLVRRFVAASIEGWRSYLKGENVAATNELIKKENPAMTDGQIAYSLEKMNEWRLVDPGPDAPHGLGTIDPERVQKFYEVAVTCGLFQAKEIEPLSAIDPSFVAPPQ
jgi:NitT/TauT family transport system substrate-binding protein